MTERMSSERVTELVHTDPWTQSDCADVEDEMLRARASEEAKDAQIKALADALLIARGWIQDGLKGGADRIKIDAALRLAGRIP